MGFSEAECKYITSQWPAKRKARLLSQVRIIPSNPETGPDKTATRIQSDSLSVTTVPTMDCQELVAALTVATNDTLKCRIHRLCGFFSTSSPGSITRRELRTLLTKADAGLQRLFGTPLSCNKKAIASSLLALTKQLDPDRKGFFKISDLGPDTLPIEWMKPINVQDVANVSTANTNTSSAISPRNSKHIPYSRHRPDDPKKLNTILKDLTAYAVASLKVQRDFPVEDYYKPEKLDELKKLYELRMGEIEQRTDTTAPQVFYVSVSQLQVEYPGLYRAVKVARMSKQAFVTLEELVKARFLRATRQQRNVILAKIRPRPKPAKHEMRQFRRLWQGFLETPYGDKENGVVQSKALVAVLARVQGLRHWIAHLDRKYRWSKTGATTRQKFVEEIFQVDSTEATKMLYLGNDSPRLNEQQHKWVRELFYGALEPSVDGQEQTHLTEQNVRVLCERDPELAPHFDTIWEHFPKDADGRLSLESFEKYYAAACKLSFFELLIGKAERVE